MLRLMVAVMSLLKSLKRSWPTHADIISFMKSESNWYSVNDTQTHEEDISEVVDIPSSHDSAIYRK